MHQKNLDGERMTQQDAAVAGKNDTLSAGQISARLDRLPGSYAIWRIVALLSLGFFFELYDLLFSGYIAPGIIRSGILSATTPGLFGTSGVAGFIAALFSGLFIGTIACGFLADKFGRRAIFTYALLWYAVANTIMAFQDTALGLNAWRFISGLGIGVELITIGSYLTEFAPKHMRQGLRGVSGSRFHRRAHRGVSFLAAGAVGAVADRRLALGGADRQFRRGIYLVVPPQSAGKPALAGGQKQAG
jgi:MFS family permease